MSGRLSNFHEAFNKEVIPINTRKYVENQQSS